MEIFDTRNFRRQEKAVSSMHKFKSFNSMALTQLKLTLLDLLANPSTTLVINPLTVKVTTPGLITLNREDETVKTKIIVTSYPNGDRHVVNPPNLFPKLPVPIIGVSTLFTGLRFLFGLFRASSRPTLSTSTFFLKVETQ